MGADDRYRMKEYLQEQDRSRDMLLQARVEHEKQREETLKVANEQLSEFQHNQGSLDRKKVVADNGRVDLKVADSLKEKVDNGGRRLITSLVLLASLGAIAFGVRQWTQEEVDG